MKLQYYLKGEWLSPRVFTQAKSLKKKMGCETWFYSLWVANLFIRKELGRRLRIQHVSVPIVGVKLECLRGSKVHPSRLLLTPNFVRRSSTAEMVFLYSVLRRDHQSRPNASTPYHPRRMIQIIMTPSVEMPLGFLAASAANSSSSRLLSASAPPFPSSSAFASSTA